LDKIARAAQSHQNLVQTTNGTIASIGLTKAGHKIAGVLVTPAVWTLNYISQGRTPDTVDVSLYAVGFAGVIGSAAAIGTGVVKAVVDDDMNKRLRQAQASENAKYRPFIKTCYSYSMMAPQISATTIASRGGTAWKHINGLWLYITDRRGYLVNDFAPKGALIVYRPKLPLTRGRNGRFLWGMTRK